MYYIRIFSKLIKILFHNFFYAIKYERSLFTQYMITIKMIQKSCMYLIFLINLIFITFHILYILYIIYILVNFFIINILLLISESLKYIK